MFTEKSYEARLATWSGFRSSLEKSETPLQDVLDYYNAAELHSQRYDPWDQDNWPTPWTLVFENKYCAFTLALGMCYSLKLVEKYKDTEIKLAIIKDADLQTRYVALIDNYILGLDNELHLMEDISNEISILKEFVLCSSIH